MKSIKKEIQMKAGHVLGYRIISRMVREDNEFDKVHAEVNRFVSNLVYELSGVVHQLVLSSNVLFAYRP